MRKRFFLLLCLWLLSLAAVAQAGQITDVKWGVDKNNVLRLVVDVTDTTGYAVKLDGSTLKLTVNATKAAQVPSSKRVKSSLADELKVLVQGSSTEVWLPLKKSIGSGDYKAFVLKKDPQTGRPFRVVLDVTADKREAVVSNTTATTAATGSKPVVSSTPVKSSGSTKTSTKATTKSTTKSASTATKKTTSATTAATTQSGDKVTAISGSGNYRTSGGLKGKIITLDAGHGGSDPGAIGAEGTKEKNITLAITQRVQELLEKEGAKVYMTRTTDVDVCGPNASDRDELQARVNVAEKYNSDLFVSLHINSSVNKSVGGFSSYYYPKTDADLKLAQKIQNKLAANFGVDNLGVRQANFYVIKRSSMPATLVEMCFISNPNEEKLMKGIWFQKKTATLIVEGIADYFA